MVGTVRIFVQWVSAAIRGFQAVVVKDDFVVKATIVRTPIRNVWRFSHGNGHSLTDIPDAVVIVIKVFALDPKGHTQITEAITIDNLNRSIGHFFECELRGLFDSSNTKSADDESNNADSKDA